MACIEDRLRELMDDHTQRALETIAPASSRLEGEPLRRAIDLLAVDVIKGIVVDAVEKASSGHPGGPLSSVDFAYVLWTRVLKVSRDPGWPDRDRFVLSGGHMSMLLYSLLYYTGRIGMEDITRFRQLGSPTQGHPVRGLCPGVETSTGPLGQGFANGVGMALAERWLRINFGSELVDHGTYVLASDGDFQEGVCREAASLAGHWGLGRLVVFFDSNAIQLASPTAATTSEDIAASFRAMGWHVIELPDGHDHLALTGAIEAARAEEGRPSLIVGHTQIARGTSKVGLVETHGQPLGAEVVRAFKEARHHPPGPFWDPPFVRAIFEPRLDRGDALEAAWKTRVEEARARDPRLAAAFDLALGRHDRAVLAREVAAALDRLSYAGKKAIATRNAGGDAMAAIREAVPILMGGSADLANSTKTDTFEKAVGYFPEAMAPGSFRGRALHFGVREHSMGSIANGMALHGGVVPFTGTFLAFSDYMRPAVRLAAISRAPCIFVFTHDSIFLGEDGETHQPVEHVDALRAIPRMVVVRPADAYEAVAAWEWAIQNALGPDPGPVCLVFTRQNVPVLSQTQALARTELPRGAYVVGPEGEGTAHLCVLASGSEVHVALEAARLVRERHGIRTRVVSVPSLELFTRLSIDERERILPPSIPLRMAVEAGRGMAWRGLTGLLGGELCVHEFGESAPENDLARKFGFTPDALSERIADLVRRYRTEAGRTVEHITAHLAAIGADLGKDPALRAGQG